MTAKLDWSFGKLYYYLLVMTAIFGFLASLVLTVILRNIWLLLISITILLIPIISKILYLHLIIPLFNHFQVLSALWFWKFSARDRHKLRLRRYRKLDSSKSEIRLLAILPGEGRDPI